MSDLFNVVIVLCVLLVIQTIASFTVISKLVDKLMSRNYFEYLDAKKNLKKPKEVYVMEDDIPQENINRVF